ncbi:MAG: glycogen/starch synthase [Desulfobacterales bacterium]|nr:glycogen/starch synthase [Desulfobacterales bacterium]MBF0397043.1 glycogen/starch synthase [Desulfobacterales bacterium]
MPSPRTSPRILIVTPEVTYLPDRMGDSANGLTAKAGGLADVSAALITSLFEQGTDVHVALPDYRAIFSMQLPPFLRNDFNIIKMKMPEERIHLAEDSAFFYLDSVYSKDVWNNIKMALAFQREVMNNIVPHVQPDLIHCNDWMTGLIPAMARICGIPCLFTIHNIHTFKCFLSYVEDRGIDARAFWKNFYYERPPYSYEETRDRNPVDLLASGTFAAHFVNTVSPTFLKEIVDGRHKFVSQQLQKELLNKYNAGCATGILNAPDPSFNPTEDKALFRRYKPEDYIIGKRENKRFMQAALGLIQDQDAPIFFWPSRLDPSQKGCQLLSDILYKVISKYSNQNLEIVFVANGEFQKHFKNIVKMHNLNNRVAIYDFDERLERIAYGASDFILMPSLFEPCGLPQMIAPIYGTLPIVHDTGGIHDTIYHMNISEGRGNGFVFEVFDSNGLFWAIDQAMDFYNLSLELKRPQIIRIMKESLATFTHDITASHYIKLYEKMLKRPLITNLTN